MGYTGIQNGPGPERNLYSMVIFCILLSLVLLALLVRIAYSRRHFHLYPAAKTAASLGFVATALARHRVSGVGDRYFSLLLACLLACLAGDLLLGLANRHAGFFSRFFLAGTVAFMAAHAGFCVLFASAPGVRLRPVLALPALVAGLAALCIRDKRRFRLKKLAPAAFVYAVCVGLMTSLALAGWLGAPSPRSALTAVGAVLFFASDALLLFLYFYHKKRGWLRAANLLTYYVGMLCLALTA